MFAKKIILLCSTLAFSMASFAEQDLLNNFKTSYLNTCKAAGGKYIDMTAICQCSVNDLVAHFSADVLLDEDQKYEVNSYFYETSLYKCRGKLTRSKNEREFDAVKDKSLIWAWALAAPINEENKWEHFSYAGSSLELNRPAYKKALSDWWGIHSRDDVLSTVAVLADGQSNQNNSFIAKIIPFLNGNNAQPAPEDADEEFLAEASKYKENLQSHELLGWDYGRAQWVIGTAYRAGYLDIDTARKLAISLAIKTQAEFSSWEEMATNYAIGYYYWSQDKARYIRRKTTTEKLLEQADSPWNLLEWAMPIK